MPEKYILLEDTNAHKLLNKQNRGILSVAHEHILKGSLLVELAEAEIRESYQHFTSPVNYKKYSDDSVKLYCKPEQVLQLNYQQFSLLLGVKSAFDRFKALSNLSWVEKLAVGFGVKVSIATIPIPVKGIIRYVGALPGEDGTKFGIELLVSIYVSIIIRTHVIWALETNQNGLFIKVS